MNSGAHTRTGLAPPQLLLGAALTYFLVAGGTELGTFLPFMVLNAVLGAVVVGIWLIRMPAHADRTDVIVLGALIVYLVACALSAFPRASFASATEALAYAATFSVARWQFGRDSSARAALTVLGVVAVCIGLVIISVWIGVWRDWLVQLGTVPPLDVRLPAGPYRHAHTVAMLMALLAPALLALTGHGARIRMAAIAGLSLAGAVVLMSGGRGVWAALAIVLAGVVVIHGARTRGAVVMRSMTPRVMATLAVAGAVLVTVAIVTGVGAAVADRIGATSTLSLRLAYWQETVQQWAQKPLAGWGPGTFDVFVTLGDYFDTQAFVPRHADNALIQLLGEGGLLGMAVVGMIVVALITGVRSAGARSSGWGIIGVALFCLMSITDNPSDTPNLVVAAIVWAAMAAPGSPDQVPVKKPSPVARGFVMASVLVVAAAVASTLAAASAFDQARIAARAGDGSAAREHLRVAVRFDPAMALYVRSLGEAEAASGDLELAERHLARAARLNPADATALRSLAFVRAERGDPVAAVQAAEQAVERRRSHPENLLTLAGLAAQAGEASLARSTLVQAIAYEPWLPASAAWNASVLPPGEMPAALREALPISAELAAAAQDWRDSHVWISALTGHALEPETATLATLDNVLRCRLDDAESTLAANPTISTGTDVGVVATLLLARLLDDEALWNRAAIIANLRMSGLELVGPEIDPADPFQDRAEDIRLYEAIAPDLSPSGVGLPSADDAMAAWLADPRRAADTVAPESALHRCGAG